MLQLQRDQRILIAQQTQQLFNSVKFSAHYFCALPYNPEHFDSGKMFDLQCHSIVSGYACFKLPYNISTILITTHAILVVILYVQSLFFTLPILS